MSTKEAMDDVVGGRRRANAPKVGSVWESRMKLDEVRGGIKVFDTSSEIDQIVGAEKEECVEVNEAAKRSPSGGDVSAKRKTWKSEGSPVQIVRQRSGACKNLEQKFKESSASVDEIKRSPISMKKTRSNLVQQRKMRSDSSENLTEKCDEPIDEDSKKSVSLQLVKVNSEEKKVIDDKNQRKIQSGSENDRPAPDVNGGADKLDRIQTSPEEAEEEVCKEIHVEIPTKNLARSSDEKGSKLFAVEKKKWLHRNERLPEKITRIHSNPTKPKSTSCSDDSQEIPRTSSRLQSFVDLIMWNNMSKSSLVFGIGAFVIISSSYTEFNISFISVASYLGLAYLAANFLFRSISRNVNEVEECVIGEEEAIFMVKLILPFINEFLHKLKALFSGDPSTTLKLAVVLFVFARIGSSITIWKMAKLGFFGVFTIPKIYSSYSLHFTSYGTFWFRRIRDAWDSCSHKKSVGFAIFALVWNLSSTVVRIWSVFLLIVAFKYYQHSMMENGWRPQRDMGSHKDIVLKNKAKC